MLHSPPPPPPPPPPHDLIVKLIVIIVIVADVPPMVQSAKALAFNITAPAKVSEWRRNNDKVSLQIL